MKQEKREYGYRSNAYIDGNTVRKEEIVPERTRRVYKDGKRVYESERQIRERERALHMNGSYVFFLTGVFAVCLAMCFGYLYVQSEISQTRSEISKLKQTLAQ